MVRLLYTTRLSKQGKGLVETTAVARRRLADEYGLSDDPDVLHGLGIRAILTTSLRRCLRRDESNPRTVRRSSCNAAHPHRLHLPPQEPPTCALHAGASTDGVAAGIAYLVVRPWARGTLPPADGRKHDVISARLRCSTRVLRPGGLPSVTRLRGGGERSGDHRLLDGGEAVPAIHLPKLFVGWNICIRITSRLRVSRSKEPLLYVRRSAAGKRTRDSGVSDRRPCSCRNVSSTPGHQARR